VTTVVSTTGAVGVNGRTVTGGGETDGDVPDADAPVVAVVAIGEPDGAGAPLEKSGIESAPTVDAKGSGASVAESALVDTVDVAWESDGAADESDPRLRLHTTIAIPSTKTTTDTGPNHFLAIGTRYQTRESAKSPRHG
jgi:hypothetical protein